MNSPSMLSHAQRRSASYLIPFIVGCSPDAGAGRMEGGESGAEVETSAPGETTGAQGTTEGTSESAGQSEASGGEDGSAGESGATGDTDEPDPACAARGLECGTWPGEGDAGSTLECGGCADDGVCSLDGACVPAAMAGDVVGQVTLIRLFNITASGALSDFGKAEAAFWNYQPLPLDEREVLQTAEGERCTFEVDSLYPYNYGGVAWPNPPFLGLGDVRLAAEGAPSHIVLHESEGPLGVFYDHGDQPPALQDGPTNLPQLFASEHVPFGADFEVAWAGGTSGSAGMLRSTFPTELRLTAPDLEQEPTISSSVDLELTWDPPRPNATLEISMASTLFGANILICTVADDGAATLPAAVVARFAYADVSLSLRRITHRRVADVAGTPRRIIDVYGRYEHVAKVTVEG